MKMLEGILYGAFRQYQKEKTALERRLRHLPVGTVKKRVIYGNAYYYLQTRQGRRVIHRYLGKKVSPKLLQNIRQRKSLRKELARIQEALAVLYRFRPRNPVKERSL